MRKAFEFELCPLLSSAECANRMCVLICLLFTGSSSLAVQILYRVRYFTVRCEWRAATNHRSNSDEDSRSAADRSNLLDLLISEQSRRQQKLAPCCSIGLSLAIYKFCPNSPVSCQCLQTVCFHSVKCNVQFYFTLFCTATGRRPAGRSS